VEETLDAVVDVVVEHDLDIDALKLSDVCEMLAPGKEEHVRKNNESRKAYVCVAF
jgi:hypothetical protein